MPRTFVALAVILLGLAGPLRAESPRRPYRRVYDDAYRHRATRSYAERYGLYGHGTYADRYGLYGNLSYAERYGFYDTGTYAERYRLYGNETYAHRYGFGPAMNGPRSRRLPFLGQNGTYPNLGGYVFAPYPWGVGYYGFYGYRGYYYGPW